MSTDDAAAPVTASRLPSDDAAPESGSGRDGARDAGPSWWHRDHPVFTPLAGFFAGLLCVFLVPAAFAGVVGAIAGASRAESLFPFVLVFLAVPLALVCFPRTRRFGGYLWLGIVTTAVVVLGVGGLVLWYMVTYQS